jgi:hypothetical protein
VNDTGWAFHWACQNSALIPSRACTQECAPIMTGHVVYAGVAPRHATDMAQLVCVCVSITATAVTCSVSARCAS